MVAYHIAFLGAPGPIELLILATMALLFGGLIFVIVKASSGNRPPAGDFCPDCGARLADSDEDCPHCGRVIM